MTKEAFRLTSPSGVEMDLPVRSGTVGPDVIDVGKLYEGMEAEIEEALRGVLGSRFTNADGERLEQRLIEHLESHLAGELDRHD